MQVDKAGLTKLLNLVRHDYADEPATLRVWESAVELAIEIDDLPEPWEVVNRMVLSSPLTRDEWLALGTMSVGLAGALMLPRSEQKSRIDDDDRRRASQGN